MLVIDDFLKVVGFAINPTARTKANMIPSEVVGLYYKAIVAPLVVVMCMTYAIYSQTSSGAFYAGIVFIDYLVVLPLLMLLLTLTLHVASTRLLKYARHAPEKAFASVFYAGSVFALLGMAVRALYLVSGVTSLEQTLLSAVIFVWPTLVLIVAFSNQQKISMLRSFYSVLVAAIIFAFFLFMIGTFPSFGTGTVL